MGRITTLPTGETTGVTGVTGVTGDSTDEFWALRNASAAPALGGSARPNSTKGSHVSTSSRVCGASSLPPQKPVGKREWIEFTAIEEMCVWT